VQQLDEMMGGRRLELARVELLYDANGMLLYVFSLLNFQLLQHNPSNFCNKNGAAGGVMCKQSLLQLYHLPPISARDA
jgi:hypothetical protein